MDDKTIEVSEMIDEDCDKFSHRISTMTRGDIAILERMFTVVYSDLANRKNAVLQSDYDDKVELAKCVYVELVKVEQKISLLRKRAEELTLAVFDSPKHK